MSANTNVARANPEPLSLAHLSDAELLTQTRSLVGRSNRLLAELLAHLGEVEARGIHRTRACSSLYTYLIYELRFSEDEAFRRVAAARLVRRFPAILRQLPEPGARARGRGATAGMGTRRRTSGKRLRGSR